MQAYTPFYAPFTLQQLLIIGPIVLVAVLLSIILKGYALWHSARNNQKWWFVALLLINTLGILELIYLIWYRPKVSTETKEVEAPPIHTSSPAE